MRIEILPGVIVQIKLDMKSLKVANHEFHLEIDYNTEYAFADYNKVLTYKQIEAIQNNDRNAFQKTLVQKVSGKARMYGRDSLMDSFVTVLFSCPIKGEHLKPGDITKNTWLKLMHDFQGDTKPVVTGVGTNLRLDRSYSIPTKVSTVSVKIGNKDDQQPDGAAWLYDVRCEKAESVPE